MTHRSAFLCLALLAVACARDSADGPGGRTGAAVQVWSLGEPTARIGGAQSLQGTVFSDVRHVVLARDGSVFVTDGKTDGILAYSAGGSFVRKIGGRGDGPGEFRSITRLGVIGDTLWAADPRSRRLQRFTLGGDVRSAHPWPAWSVRFPNGDGYAATVTGLLPGARHVAYVPEPPAGREAPPHGTVGPLVRIDSAGKTVDTITWLPSAPEALLIETSKFLHFPGPNHFADTPLWTVASDGSAIVVVERPVAVDSSSAKYRVSTWNAAGRPGFSVEVGYAPVRVARSVVDSIVEVFTDDVASFYPSRDVGRKLVRDSLIAPQFYPPVSDIVVGIDGRVWLAREGLVMPPFSRRRYDVLDARGAHIATLTLANPGRICAATSDAVWVVELDADDVPTLLRYPLRTR